MQQFSTVLSHNLLGKQNIQANEVHCARGQPQLHIFKDCNGLALVRLALVFTTLSRPVQ